MNTETIVVDGNPKASGEVTASSHLRKMLPKLGFPIFSLRKANGLKKARKAVLRKETKTVVFATPTNWFNVSAVMKEFIDQLPEGPRFRCEGKTAFFFVVGDEDGLQQAANQMIAPLNHMGFWIPPYATYFYNINIAKRKDKSEGRWMSKGIKELQKRLKAKKKFHLPLLPP